jgi:glycine oxidase
VAVARKSGRGTRSRFDVIIVGGGVIGCSIARELAGRGLSVAVVERGEPGAEASSAAAGMLAPQAESAAPGPLLDLGLESRLLHSRWAQELAAETGIDVGYRRCGILRCCFAGDGRLSEAAEWQRIAGLAVEYRDAASVASMTQGLVSRGIVEGLFFPEDAIVNSVLFMRAVAQSAQLRGAQLLPNTPARRFRIENGVCTGVDTDDGTLEAELVVDAAGAWAGFDEALPFEIPVEPVRGQMVELALPGRELPTVVQDDEVYLVPRRGGSLLAGATVERVGYVKDVTASGLAGLLAAAIRLAPDLAHATFERAWAGLRPGTPDGLPILGATPLAGLFLAAGHFRNGVLLAPATAQRMADLLTGGEGRGLESFSISRFAAARSNSSTASPGSGVFS